MKQKRREKIKAEVPDLTEKKIKTPNFKPPYQISVQPRQCTIEIEGTFNLKLDKLPFFRI